MDINKLNVGSYLKLIKPSNWSDKDNLLIGEIYCVSIINKKIGKIAFDGCSCWQDINHFELAKELTILEKIDGMYHT